jgi:hypothetical protein
MDDKRRDELRASLERELKEKSAQEQLSSRDRIHWLADRLGEYLERWLGFCAISDASMPPLVDHVLFGMVEIGAEVLTEELRRPSVPRTISDAWYTFPKVLETARSWNEKSEAEQLRVVLAGWRSKLAAATW